MKIYSSLDQLFAGLYSFESGEWIYVNTDSWGRDPTNTNFYYIPFEYLESLDGDEIYLDDEDMEMPKQVQDLGLRSWMLVSSLLYIASKKAFVGNDSSWVVDEINYFRIHDTFRT